jgi:hypothetical protein
VTTRRVARAVVALAIPIAILLVAAAGYAQPGEGFVVTMDAPEERHTEYPFRCMRKDYAFANGRVFVQDDGLFWAGLDDSFRGYSGKSKGDPEEAAHEFCRKVLQRIRDGR